MTARRSGVVPGGTAGTRARRGGAPAAAASRLVERLGRIVAADDQEADDLAEVTRWVASGEPLYRTVPPATPPRHLAVYLALVDEATRCVLLVDHVKAGCRLLPGGHVDPGEDPYP